MKYLLHFEDSDNKTVISTYEIITQDIYDKFCLITEYDLYLQFCNDDSVIAEEARERIGRKFNITYEEISPFTYSDFDGWLQFLDCISLTPIDENEEKTIKKFVNLTGEVAVTVIDTWDDVVYFIKEENGEECGACFTNYIKTLEYLEKLEKRNPDITYLIGTKLLVK